MALTRPQPRLRDFVLVALRDHPLDRIRIMKTLFLVWHRSGRPSGWPVSFRPYHYGPYDLGVYRALDELEAQGLIHVRPGRHPTYRLSDEGHEAAARSSLPEHIQQQLRDVGGWAAKQDFISLLKRVYDEAPEFAAKSLLRSLVP